jgi:uncharacterized membrane protein YeaQ/YmgE (transglycosylase-associated protein family)
MGILAWIAFGFVVGLIARALLPGDQKMGLIKTTLLGVGGSFAGGTIGNLLSGEKPDGMSAAGFGGSLLGAMLLLVVFGMIFNTKKP